MQNTKVTEQLNRRPHVPRPLGSDAKVPSGVTCVLGEEASSVIGVAGAAKASSIVGANSSSSMGSSDIAAHGLVEYGGRFADARDTG